MPNSPKPPRLLSNSSFIQENSIPFEAMEYEEPHSGILRRYQFNVTAEVNDLYFLPEFTIVLKALLASLIIETSGCKYQIVLTANYKSLGDETKPAFPMHLRRAYYRDFRGEDIASSIEPVNHEIMARNDHILRFESGVRLERIFYATVFGNRLDPITGAHFKPRPVFLQSKKSISNVQHNDQRCFAYAILSATKQNVKRPNRAHSDIDNLARSGLNYIHYPVEPTDVPLIEQRLRMRINLFSFYYDLRYPLIMADNGPISSLSFQTMRRVS